MRKIEPSAFIDILPSEGRAAASQLAYSDAPLTGVVVGVVDAALGLVEVQIDGTSETAVVTADAGLTYVGARVSLPRDSSGRITGVRAPSGVTPAGATVIPVGETGRQLLDTSDRVTALDGELAEAKNLVEANHQEVTRRVAAAESTVAGAQARADQVAGELAVERERVTGAVSRLGTVESSVGSLGERLEAAEADTATAKTAATQAQSAASQAQASANEAAANALAAQATADAANSRMATLDGEMTVAYRTPTNADGVGKPVDSVWWQLNGTVLQAMWVWTGTAWTQSKAGMNFVGPNSIGVAQIAQGILGQLTAAHGQLNDANIGALNVSKLVVTGGATIPQAVLQALVSDEAFINLLYANRLVVSAGNMIPDPYFDRGSVTWNGDIVAGAGEPGHQFGMRMPTPAAGSSDMTQYAQFPKNWQGQVPVRPGVKYYAECSYKVGSHVPGVNWYSCQVYFYNESNQMVPGQPNNQMAGRSNAAGITLGEWNVVGGLVTAPPGATYAVVRPTVYVAAGSAQCTDPVYVGHQLFREAVGSTLIEPGAITTPHIATDAIDARTVNASSVAGAVGQFIQVTTDQITAGSAKIAGELIADDISGKTISGSEFHLPEGAANSRKGIHLTLPGAESTVPLLVFNAQDKNLLNNGSTDYTFMWSGGLHRRNNRTVSLPNGESRVIPIQESMSWDDLVAPPAAEFRFKQADMAKIPDSPAWAEASLDLSKASYKEMKNGITLYDGWAVVPIGRYLVEVTTDWYWESTQESWAMSSAVWRMYNSGIDWENDPFATAKLIPGVTTRVAAIGTMSVAQTGYIRPAYWQNTGSWKPKACSFVIHRMVGGYQPLGVELPQ